MALLEVKKLTMRFGGLTAVNQVDFSVEPGQIFSVIGPNGAGKTTVFNAVTGVYEPTEGEVLFEGRDPRRSLNARVIAGIALIGLLSGLALAVFSADIDAMWRTVIVLNTPDPGEPFPVGKAVDDAWTFLTAGVMTEREDNRLAELELRERQGRWVIRGRSTRTVIESHEDEKVAGRRLDVLEGMFALAGSLRTTVSGSGKWLVTAREGDPTWLLDTEGSARTFAGAREGSTLGPAPALWYVLDPNQRVLSTFASKEEARQALFDLAVKGGKLRWRLVTRTSAQPLGVVQNPQMAARERRAIQAVFRTGGKIIEKDGKAFILAGDLDLGPFEDRDAAEDRLKQLLETRSAVIWARVLLVLALVAGVGIGTGGAWAVWWRSRRTPEVIARHGLARTFQNIRLFPDMLAIENVLMGMDTKLRSGLTAQALRLPSLKAEETVAKRKALELLEFVGLKERAWDVAKSLPYGDQRRLEIARALATEPKLLLLDEPAAGMNPAESADLTKLIAKIRDRGITVLLIEHHMKVVMDISDRIVVLDYGTKIAEGTPAEVKANPRVIEAYLGKEEVT